MIADGSDVRVTHASRGGADRDIRAGGKVTVNNPVRILLPSAGSGSPPPDAKAQGDAIAAFPREEVERWMEEYGVSESW